MIEVQSLTKSYGDRLAIDHLTFKVNKGEIVGFLGPNGAGKSTTMKIITGFMAPSDGAVRVGGVDVFEEPVEVKKRIGYLPEIPPVYPDMIVKDYLKFVAQLKGVESHRIPSLVDMSIEKTNLQEVTKRMIQNLSKGFRQRVGIAQALVSDPEILILDEPTVGLDPKQVAEIRKLIATLKGQHTVVLSTHILPEVQANCERVIIINEGKIVAEDSLKDLSSRMKGNKRVYIRVKESAKVESTLSGLSGIQNVTSEVNSFKIDYDGNEDTVLGISSALVNSGAGLLEMKQDEVGLEDIFIQLTSDGGAQ